jgi:DNA invertase Pin-like site-specific DNA recombinase
MVNPRPEEAVLIPYIRQSRRSERTISIEEQRRDIRRWADQNQVALGAEIVEQNVSGSRPWRERALGQAVRACEEGRADGIIVAWQDRLSRENGLATAEVWDALGRADARLVCAAEGLDTESGDHELTFSIKAAIARDQWKRHKANWERARRNAIERGAHIAAPPVGYRRSANGNLEPDEYADVIREAFELRADGGSWTQVARLLTERGVPTGRVQYYERHGPEKFEEWTKRPFSEQDRRWIVKSAAQLLRNPTYMGIVRSGEFERIDAHEALVSRDLFERVQARRDRRTRHTEGERSLLAGVLVCAGCGARMSQAFVQRPNGSRTPLYRCRNGVVCSAQATITHSRVEPYVEAQALALLGAIDFGTAEHQGPSAELRTAVAEAETELRTFVELVPATTLGFADGLARRQSVLREARDAAGAATVNEEAWVHLSSAQTAEIYGRMALADKRKVIAACVERAVVRRGAGPVEARVSVELRPHPLANVTPPDWVTQPIEYVEA